MNRIIRITIVLAAVSAMAAERNDESPELVRARQAYEAQVRTVTAPVRAQYLRQLDIMKAQAGTRGNAAEAIALLDEINKVRSEGGMPLAFDWAKLRGQTSYTYLAPTTFAKSIGYGDGNATKLLDGTTGITWGEATSVGWLKTDPSPILFKFPRPQLPSAIGLYFFKSNVAGGIEMPKGVRVYKGTKAVHAEMIGECTKIPDRTGWLEIPLNCKTPTDNILVEIESPATAWVVLDEVQFK